MTTPIEKRLERLRGALPSEEPGARGIERVGRNPECIRLRALTIVGITPTTAARQIYGETIKEGQSPFALAIGNRVERALTENGAAALLKLYRDAGRLSPTECKIAIIPDFAPGIGQAVNARRLGETNRLLRLKAGGHRDAPNLIIKPRLRIKLVDVLHGIEPDALVAADSDRFYRPVELKSYPDRGGKTAPADIRGACRQAAVEVIALRQTADLLGMNDASRIILPEGDLVLRVPGSLKGN